MKINRKNLRSLIESVINEDFSFSNMPAEFVGKGGLEPTAQNQKSLPEMVMEALRIGLPAGEYKCEMEEDSNGVASIECSDAMNDLVFIIQFQS